MQNDASHHRVVMSPTARNAIVHRVIIVGWQDLPNQGSEQMLDPSSRMLGWRGDFAYHLPFWQMLGAALGRRRPVSSSTHMEFRIDWAVTF